MPSAVSDDSALTTSPHRGEVKKRQLNVIGKCPNKRRDACPIMASQMFPSLSIVIIRLPRRKAGLRHGNRIARNLAGLGVQFRDELVLEIGEPNVARFVEQRVMGRGVIGKIVGRDDGLR